MSAARWIDLEGAENVRDLGGLRAAGGRQVRPGRLIRSDSLQDLTPADVRHLVDDLHVRAVADLRTGVELRSEGPGPMTREPDVRIEHLSLFPESGTTTDAAADVDGADVDGADVDGADVDGADVDGAEDGPVLLPWHTRDRTEAITAEEKEQRRRGASGVYLRYLDERNDSIVAALRLIAGTDGATIVHCAAGKDRTGVVVAMALGEVGVPYEAIAADYALSGERIAAIYRRLGSRRTYAADLAMSDPDQHRPRIETMQRLLSAIDDVHGGIPAWLRANGWTEDDAAALRRALLH